MTIPANYSVIKRRAEKNGKSWHVYLLLKKKKQNRTEENI